jgi:hypothetical protein
MFHLRGDLEKQIKKADRTGEELLQRLQPLYTEKVVRPLPGCGASVGSTSNRSARRRSLRSTLSGRSADWSLTFLAWRKPRAAYKKSSTRRTCANELTTC